MGMLISGMGFEPSKVWDLELLRPAIDRRYGTPVPLACVVEAL